MRPDPALRHPLDLGALLGATVLAASAVLGLLPDRTSLGADLAWVWPAACAAVAAAWFASLVSRSRAPADRGDAAGAGQVPASDEAGPSDRA